MPRWVSRSSPVGLRTLPRHGRLVEIEVSSAARRSDRAKLIYIANPPVAVHLPEQTFTIGSIDPPGGPRLDTDLESLVRLLSGRRPDPKRYVFEGGEAEELVFFF
ncbi:MAG TPA: hypothetical protein VHM94_01725 [Acidimicrobiia bacterium]|nr:hypothetical protein [Acidimicrobiia bacterium]